MDIVLSGMHIHIRGIVQGVGFRPFVYGLAKRLHLQGWVRNTSAGVDIEVAGPLETLAAFVNALRTETPPLARIDELTVQESVPGLFSGFEIVHSETIAGAFQPISPDAATCPDCLREMNDPQDRRYHYPFTNCTNCGPRFTIIQDIPYDRAKTSMAGFALCADCASEYSNPLDRRFHAQPLACPVCGPQVWLENGLQLVTGTRGQAALEETRRLLAEGKIVAIKGLGGFHLACDAENDRAVAELRQRKLRVDKAFAVMVASAAEARRQCFVSEAESAQLEARERPIVILRRRPGTAISAQAAPNQDTLGVMLPYTPLHHLLFGEGAPYGALVMTSGNLSEEPIAITNEEARAKLAPLADAFLMHDRPIHTRCDDSVVRVFHPLTRQSAPFSMPYRRSRGYAPFPVCLPFDAPPLLAAGAELKNTFCITRERYAFLSQHTGDLENYETLRSFEEGIAHFESIFRVKPQALAYDLHPNYLATRYAQERAEREGLPAVGVQHHHAHIAAVMAENGLPGDLPVIGVAFDGSGYGEDGAIWGGEFLLAHYGGFQRVYHLAYVPLPGGDAAVRKPARTALAHLWQAGLDWEPGLPSVEALGSEECTALYNQLTKVLNTPLTSSMGRLFDAVSSLAGVRHKINYEGQAAIELEALVDPVEQGSYEFGILPMNGKSGLVQPRPLFKALIQDLRVGAPVEVIAARFHNGVAGMVLQVCQQIRTKQGLTEVALSGGVWQNVTLLQKTLALLEEDGFTVYVHRQVPANDGGLALGQAVIAANTLF